MIWYFWNPKLPGHACMVFILKGQKSKNFKISKYAFKIQNTLKLMIGIKFAYNKWYIHKYSEN